MTDSATCQGHDNGFGHLELPVPEPVGYDLGEKWEELVAGLPRAAQKKLYHVSYRLLGSPGDVARTIRFIRTAGFFTPNDRTEMKVRALEVIPGAVSRGDQGDIPV